MSLQGDHFGRGGRTKAHRRPVEPLGVGRWLEGRRPVHTASIGLGRWRRGRPVSLGGKALAGDASGPIAECESRIHVGPGDGDSGADGAAANALRASGLGRDDSRRACQRRDPLERRPRFAGSLGGRSPRGRLSRKAARRGVSRKGAVARFGRRGRGRRDIRRAQSCVACRATAGLCIRCIIGG